MPPSEVTSTFDRPYRPAAIAVANRVGRLLSGLGIGGKPITVDGVLSDAHLAFAGGAVHVLGRHFWRGRGLDGDFEMLRFDFRSELRRLCPSNHYGLLLVMPHVGVYQVKLPPARGGP